MWFAIAGLTAAAAGLSILGSHAQRRAIQEDEQERRRALYLQAENLQQQRELEKKQVEARQEQNKETLEQTIALQNAIAGASGLGTNAPSFAAIRRNDRDRFRRTSNLDEVFLKERQKSLDRNISALLRGVSVSIKAENRRIGANTIQGASNLFDIGVSAYRSRPRKSSNKVK